MTCGQFLVDASDWVEGSLATDRAEALKRHACDCGACARTIADFHTLRADLRAAIDEPIDQSTLRDVRAAVLEELSARPTFGLWGAWRTRIAWTLAAIAAFVCGWTVFDTVDPLPEPTIAVIAPSQRLAPSPAVSDSVSAARELPQAPAVPETEAPPPAPQEIEVFALNTPPETDADVRESVILKLPSTNPDVVLYWVSETHGGS